MNLIHTVPHTLNTLIPVSPVVCESSGPGHFLQELWSLLS